MEFLYVRTHHPDQFIPHQLLKGLWRRGLDLILPPVCPLTREPVERAGMVHPALWRELDFITSPFCYSCGLPFSSLIDDDEDCEDQALLCGHCSDHPPTFDKARSLFLYQDRVRQLILGFKHGDRTHLSHTFACFFLQQSRDLIMASDLIAPVPIHKKRLRKRRYNQAALIAAQVAQLGDLALQQRLLERTRATPPQSGNLKARTANVKNAFALREPDMLKRVRGKTILLIDDVYTTGATVNGCAKVLKQAGAVKVHVLTVARVGRS